MLVGNGVPEVEGNEESRIQGLDLRACTTSETKKVQDTLQIVTSTRVLRWRELLGRWMGRATWLFRHGGVVVGGKIGLDWLRNYQNLNLMKLSGLRCFEKAMAQRSLYKNK